MVASIIKRLFSLPFVLVAVTGVVFLVTIVVPGNAATTIALESGSPETIHEIEQQLGLNENPFRRYVTWVGNVAQGDFGRSLLSPISVGEVIGERLPVTVELAGWAMLVSLAIGLPLGVMAARRPDRTGDNVSRGIAILSMGMPEFIVGMILIYIFAWKLRWLPPVGYRFWGDGAVPHLRSLVLPAVTLGFSQVGPIIRQTRSALLSELSRDYVLVARTKGIGATRVLVHHALRNAWVPIVTIVGLGVGRWLGGAVIVEVLFGIPGVGRLAVDSITREDVPMLQGSILVLVVGVVVANLVTDLLYLVIDPRIRQT
jgi:peptide/nickel transport system permease protein